MLLVSILFLSSTLSSWVADEVKLSTKNPDLNLLSPEESVINRFAVFVSNRDKAV